jgi:hypothetical protein
MNSEKTNHTKHKREFNGCVELIPPPPVLIEFVTTNRIWGFPIRQLKHFILGNNPEHHGKKNLPPDLLALIYDTSIVFLFGWRLELMVGPLAAGRVARVHAEKHLGTLMIEEAWVSEIKIIPRLDAIQL